MRVGIDLGGTTVGIGLVDDSFQLLANQSFRTAGAADSSQMVEIVLNGIETLLGNHSIPLSDIDFIGMGCAGEVDAENGVTVHADNLPVDNVPFVKILSEKYSKPVKIDNDANCAAWGEHIAGVSKGYRNIVTVTLGTGIGGGVIIDGRILHGNENHAGEIGHMVIDVHGKRCGCGRIGCWETVASTRALIKDVEFNARAYPDSVLGKMVSENNGRAGGRLLFRALETDDSVAKNVLRNWIENLQVGIWNVINIFRPEMIVISGGISNEKERLILPLRAAVGNCSTLIEAGELGGRAGIVGAAALDRSV